MSGERMRVAVAGAGGMGREALAWLRDARPDVEPVAFFVADLRESLTGAAIDLPLIVSVAGLREVGVSAAVLGIGNSTTRSNVDGQFQGTGIELVSVVHPTVFLGPGVEIGAGCIVGPGCVLTRDIRVGRAAIVNFAAAIGHDCALGDYSFIGPRAVLTGAVTVGRGSFVGAGAVILPGCSIGGGATVGAGSVVTQDVLPGSVVVGVPAKQMSMQDGR